MAIKELQIKTTLRFYLPAGHWWFIPVIPATQEAVFRRIIVQRLGKQFGRPYFEK
jgi:hypothetical protein